MEPEDELPPDTSAILTLNAGLASALGAEPGEAKAEVVNFDTYPEFSFAGIRCTSNDDNELFLSAKSDQAGKEAFLCNPMRPVSLAFTTPILRSQVQKNVALSPDLAGGRTDFNPWGDENRDWSGLSSPHKRGNLYYVGLPVGLKAAKTYTVTIAGPLSYWQKFKNLFLSTPITAIEDEMGRGLKSPVSFIFSTNHRNPDFELPYNDAVLESGIDSEIPLYVNNLTEYGLSYRLLTTKGLSAGKTFKRPVSEIKDVQYGVPLGLRDMIGSGSGALFGQSA